MSTVAKDAALHKSSSTGSRGTIPNMLSMPNMRGFKSCNTLSGPSFWKRVAETAGSRHERDGRLPFDVSHLGSDRLEPLIKSQPWSPKHRTVELRQRSPSPHWRSVLECDAAAPVPIHRLFAIAQFPVVSDETPRHEPDGGKAERTDYAKPLSLLQVSHMSLHASIAAAWHSIQQLPKPWSGRVPMLANSATGWAASGHAVADRPAFKTPFLNFGHLPSHWSDPADAGGVHHDGHALQDSTCSDDEAWQKWKELIDLTHGTQGVVSKLSSTLHGPGGGREQLPVVDLTEYVPCRTMQQRQGLAGSTSAISAGRSKQAALGPLHPDDTHAVVSSGGASITAVDSLMTSVHAVGEVLHVLAEFQPGLSQNLFHHLIDWSTQLARQKFVPEVDYAVPKALVERAVAELRRVGKTSEPNGQLGTSTRMTEDQQPSSPVKSWACAAAKCKVPKSSASIGLQEPGATAMMDSAGKSATSRGSSSDEVFFVRGNARGVGQGSENCPPLSTQQPAQDAKVRVSCHHSLIAALGQRRLPAARGASWLQGPVHFTCPPDTQTHDTVCHIKVSRPVLNQKRFEWKAHGMSETFCCRMSDVCNSVLEAAASRPVTARADDALEMVADGPLLLKGLVCNRGNSVLVPCEWRQVETVPARPTVLRSSKPKSPTDVCTANTWYRTRRQHNGAGLRTTVKMHGWDENQEQITMAPAYQPSDTILSPM